jgi:hypothetical protein
MPPETVTGATVRAEARIAPLKGGVTEACSGGLSEACSGYVGDVRSVDRSVGE